MGCFGSVVVLMGLAGGAFGAEAPGSSAESAQAAIERSLGFMSREAVSWVRERKCASCHHAPMMLWTVGEARARGFAIDADAFREVESFALTPYTQPKASTPPPKEGETLAKKLSLELVYLTLAERGLPADDKMRGAVLARFIEHFRETQTSDGYWDPQFARPPVFDARAVTTLFTLWALATPPLRDAAELAPLREKALAALKANPPDDSTQSLNLRLIVNAETPLSGLEAAKARQQLLGRQNADGGWSQTPEMPSDAYSTGQTLYALAVSGAPDDAAFRRAQAFLMSTQLADGSWPMSSRPFGPEGKIAKDLRPISYFGTGWATLALLRTTPPAPAASGD